MKRTFSSALIPSLCVLALAGCYESADVTRHEPGVYKGVEDPLVEKLANADGLRDQLDQRFDGQRDR